MNFRVILDDDMAGRAAKERYVEEFLLSDAELVTLGEISETLKGKSFEAIYQNDVLDDIKAEFSTTKVNKKQFALYFQRLLAEKNDKRYELTEAAFLPLSK